MTQQETAAAPPPREPPAAEDPRPAKVAKTDATATPGTAATADAPAAAAPKAANGAAAADPAPNGAAPAEKHDEQQKPADTPAEPAAPAENAAPAPAAQPEKADAAPAAANGAAAPPAEAEPKDAAAPAAAPAADTTDAPAGGENGDAAAAAGTAAATAAAPAADAKPEGEEKAEAAAEPKTDAPAEKQDEAPAAPEPAASTHEANGASKEEERTAAVRDLSTVPLRDYVAAATPAAAPLNPAALGEAAGAEAVAAFRAAVAARGAVGVLLAAGQGSRFKAAVPKVVHPFCGRPLAQHAVAAAAASALPLVVIVGHARAQVVAALDAGNKQEDKEEGEGKKQAEATVAFVGQDEQLGTGHAVYLAKCALPQDFDGDLVVCYADNPGMDGALVGALLDAHKANKERLGEAYAAMIVTGSRKAAGPGAEAYGRIVRAAKGADGGSSAAAVVDIVEKKTVAQLRESGETRTYGGDATWTAAELEAIDEFNSGIVVARAKAYLDALGDVVGSQTKTEPVAKYEYYATDFVKGLVAKGRVVEGFQVPAEQMWKLEGANTVAELEELEAKQAARQKKAETAKPDKH